MLKFVVLGVAGLLVAGLGYRWWNKNTVVDLGEIRDRQRVPVVINQKKLTVEAVTTPASITLGLGGRREIGADGMLFIFPEPGRPAFWMKGMQFDLDLVWLNEKTVVGVDAHVPALSINASSSELPVYQPPGVVDMVLEIPAGRAAELGIVTGTKLELK